ncbi:MAG: hypothetical protein OSB03_16990, partial [Vicinamibacterales bacterium]|nr:hypothetical protein [Vicinamibacterales bacterium]
GCYESLADATGCALDTGRRQPRPSSTRMTSRTWRRCGDWRAVAGTELLATRSFVTVSTSQR